MLFKLPFYNRQITINDLFALFFLKNPREKALKWLRDFFQTENILFCKSGRQGIKVILESLDLKKEDEVIIPAFICSVVPKAVLRAGGKPVFCDVEKGGFNMDFKKLKGLISSKTRAIILVYTFGIPAPTDRFLELAKERDIILIEDCAHALGAKYKDRLVGQLGDFAVFSFGFSKNVGGVGGGFILAKKRDTFQKIREIMDGKQEGKSSFRQWLELMLIPFVFNKYLYFLFANLVEKYGQLRRKKENDREFLSNISNLEIKVAWLKLKRYKKDQEKRNNNALIYQRELKDIFSFPIMLQNSQPAFPYFPVFAPPKTFSLLLRWGLPVEKVDFGKASSGDYFLLPLNYSKKDIKLIVKKIKEFL